MTDASVATRVDPDLGIREIADYIGPSREIYAFLHAPTGSPVGGLVVCSPIESELERNYRREVLLGRSLASRGIAVARFDYRGSGHSDGDPEERTYEGLVEDALTATRWLEEQIGIARPAFLGTRLGAMVAASAAARFPGSPLTLWEPVVAPPRYFREVFRSRSVYEMKRGKPRTPQRALFEELRSVGKVNIVGYVFHRGFVDSVMGRSLLEEIGEEPRPVLLIQLGHGEELRAGSRTVAARLEELGFAIDARVVAEPTVWWLDGGGWQPEEGRPGVQQLLDVTAEWIARRTSEEG